MLCNRREWSFARQVGDTRAAGISRVERHVGEPAGADNVACRGHWGQVETAVGSVGTHVTIARL
jgi:hypothetical protein